MSNSKVKSKEIKLNPRQKKFVRKHFQEGKNLGMAYSESYGVPYNKSSMNMGSALLDKIGKSKSVKQVKKQMKKDAQWAYENYKSLYSDPKTPAAVKEKILKSCMSFAELDAVTKVQTTEIKEPPYPGLNDPQSLLELGELAIKKAKADMAEQEQVPTAEAIKQAESSELINNLFIKKEKV